MVLPLYLRGSEVGQVSISYYEYLSCFKRVVGLSRANGSGNQFDYVERTDGYALMLESRGSMWH